MQFIKSCGAVVFTREKGEIHYVIIRQTNGDCGFPKGHMEPGESEQAAALREINEEVGLHASLVDGFRFEVSYPFPSKPGLIKQVVYFLAAFSDQEIHHQEEELTGAYLLPYEEALQILTFAETKNILTEADCFLRR